MRIPLVASAMSFTLTVLEQGCMFAKRYYYRASLRPGMLFPFKAERLCKD
jgi:hypothetical protein